MTVTARGYVQARAERGRGGKTVDAGERDAIAQVIETSTLSAVLFFSDRGRAYRLTAHDVPKDRLTAAPNLFQMGDGEQIVAVIDANIAEEHEHIVFVTQQGSVKRTELSEFVDAGSRRDGIVAMKIADDDRVVAVFPGWDEFETLVVTRAGQGIRFAEADVRPVSRSAGGIRAIRLRGDDRVVGGCAVAHEEAVVIATDAGFAKRLYVDELAVQARGGAGVRVMRLDRRRGSVVALAPVAGALGVRARGRRGLGRVDGAEDRGTRLRRQRRPRPPEWRGRQPGRPRYRTHRRSRFLTPATFALSRPIPGLPFVTYTAQTADQGSARVLLGAARGRRRRWRIARDEWERRRRPCGERRTPQRGDEGQTTTVRVELRLFARDAGTRRREHRPEPIDRECGAEVVDPHRRSDEREHEPEERDPFGERDHDEEASSVRRCERRHGGAVERLHGEPHCENAADRSRAQDRKPRQQIARRSAEEEKDEAEYQERAREADEGETQGHQSVVAGSAPGHLAEAGQHQEHRRPSGRPARIVARSVLSHGRSLADRARGRTLGQPVPPGGIG